MTKSKDTFHRAWRLLGVGVCLAALLLLAFTADNSTAAVGVGSVLGGVIGCLLIPDALLLSERWWRR